jgi:DNA-binding transcriptional ArsR family regulator
MYRLLKAFACGRAFAAQDIARTLWLSVIVHQMVNSLFKALSHPIRRQIVERLAAGPATVGEVTSDFGVSKPAISKHLKVLEESGVISRVIDGRNHVLSLRTETLDEATEWMVRQREIWTRLFDVVEDHLKEEQR